MAPAIDNTTAKSLRVALPAPHLGVLLGLNRGARDELVSQIEDRLSAVSRPLLGVSCRINAIGSTAMFVSAYPRLRRAWCRSPCEWRSWPRS